MAAMVENEVETNNPEDANHVQEEESSLEEYTLNDAVEHIGFGKFQVKIMLITGLCWMADAMEMMVLSIIAPYLKCKWNLTSFEEAFITTVVFIGMAIGSTFWGYFSDKFGRKKGMNISVLLVLVFGIASSQAPSYAWILALRLLVGFGIGGVPQAVTIVTEFLPNRVRGKAIIILELFWALGSVFAAALAIGTISQLSWRWYLIFITIPSLLFLIASLWIPESPHYLLTTGKKEEVEKLMVRIAKHNKKELPIGKLVPVEINRKRGHFFELLSKHWWRTTLLLWIIWCVSALSYYGIVLLTTEVFQSGINGCNPHIKQHIASITHSLGNYHVMNENSTEHCKELTNKDYTDFMVTSIAEFPGLILALALVDLLGRKKTLSALFALSAVSFLLLNICTPRTVTVVFMFAVRGFVTGAFQAAYVYTPEVLPTSIRAIGLGTCSMFARFGAMITPFIAQVLINQSFYLVVGIYALFLIICVVASLLLPIETKGKALKSSTATSMVERKGYQAFK